MPEIFTYEPNAPVVEDEEWNVLVSPMEDWTEQRRIKSSKPRRRFSVAFRARSMSEAKNIYDFYNRMSGDANTFYWKNPLENPITAEVIGSGDGAATVFYTDNYPLASGSYVIRVQGVQKVEGTDYTVSGGTGAITFKAGSIPASGNEIQMDYDFYRVVRFEGRPNRQLVSYQLQDVACRFIEVL